MNLTKLLLGSDAKVKTLAVLDVVVNGRLKRTSGKTARQIRRECGGILDDKAVHIRIEVGQLCSNQLVEERATERER